MERALRKSLEPFNEAEDKPEPMSAQWCCRHGSFL